MFVFTGITGYVDVARGSLETRPRFSTLPTALGNREAIPTASTPSLNKDEAQNNFVRNQQLTGYSKMPFLAGLTELRFAKGDLAEARRQAECFLDFALATAERTYQGLAWEANARVAMAAQDWMRAEECIANALLAIECYEVPLAAWRVHGTAAEIYTRAQDNELAERHCELSRATILKLASSTGPEEPLRTTFLSAPASHDLVHAKRSVSPTREHT